MSNPEEMLVQLINSINKLSNLVQNVNEAINKLSTQITNLEGKMAGFSTVENQVSEVGLKLGEIPGIKNMIENLTAKIDGLSPADAKKMTKAVKATKEEASPAEKKPTKKEEYVSPGVEEEPAFSTSDEADAAFTAVSSKFKHIAQMISPQSSCGNITSMLEELRDEVETHVGMSPMLYELNSWVQRVGKMPESDILLPEVHSELVEKLDDWLQRVTKAIHLKYQGE
jgi:outer membrane murein-binding lipoprotein Lpp